MAMTDPRYLALDGPEVDPEAPLDAGPPPLFDVMSFSQWVTRVFTEEHENAILDKLSGMPADDDNAKMCGCCSTRVASKTEHPQSIDRDDMAAVTAVTAVTNFVQQKSSWLWRVTVRLFPPAVTFTHETQPSCQKHLEEVPKLGLLLR